jgi:hypothetical protein
MWFLLEIFINCVMAVWIELAERQDLISCLEPLGRE